MKYRPRYRPGFQARRRIQLQGSVAVMMSLTSLAAWCSPSPGVELSHMHSPHFQWAGQHELSVFGVPVHVRGFTASLPLDKAAMAMAAHTDRFQRVMAYHDKILLSGSKASWHWVAELEATTTGVKGMVSALPIHPSSHARSPNEYAGLPWLAQKARLRFRQQSRYGDRAVVHEIYSTSVPVAELMSYVQENLRRAGWENAETLKWLPAASVWRRQDTRMALLARKAARQTALFVHYF